MYADNTHSKRPCPEMSLILGNIDSCQQLLKNTALGKVGLLGREQKLMFYEKCDFKIKRQHVNTWYTEAFAFVAQYCFHALNSKNNLCSVPKY